MASDAAVTRRAWAVMRGNTGVVGLSPFFASCARAALAACWETTPGVIRCHP